MTELVTKHKNNGRCEGFILAVIFFLAAVVRLIGPATTIALGQSDAYAHLQYLNDMVKDGHLRHSTYPPGYYWLMSLPVKLFDVDSYWVARFGGVIWGLGQVLGVYLLAGLAFGRRAAVWSAGLIAVFPLFHLLQKTGVGMYPSQAGLVILPLLLLLWDRVMRGGPHYLAGFVICLSALAVTVPMMLVDFMPFILVDFVVRYVAGSVHRRSMYALVVLAAVMITMILFFWLRSGADGFFRTASIVANEEIPGDHPLARLLYLLWMFIRPERFLFPGVWLNIAAFAVGMALVSLFFLRKDARSRSIVLWAFLAWAQTSFGVFQFELYMRAGWVLLLAGSVLSGWIVVRVFDFLPASVATLFKSVVIAACVASFVYPPAPKPHLSAAESDLVFALRDVQRWAQGIDGEVRIDALRALDSGRPSVVWSRRFNGFYGRQGDPVPALLERCSSIEIPLVGKEINFDPAKQHVILLDDEVTKSKRFWVMQLINPALIDQFIAGRDKFDVESIKLRKALDSIGANHWCVARTTLPEGLEVVSLNFRE